MPLSTIDTSSISGLGYGFKNRLINGGMVIDQRNAGASASISSYGYGVDRWGYQCSSGGVWTSQRSSTAPAGFSNSLALTVTTADASIGSTDVYQLFQKVEGFNVADLGFGTANAQSITISFWVRSSVTGTYSVSVQNNAFNRGYVSTITINSANTWEQKSLTITGDTTGTWAIDNTIGLQLAVDLGSGSGSNYTAGSWQTTTTSTARTSGSVSWIANAGATFYITGVQLEAGTVATSFDWRPYGTELALCQRYFSSSFVIGTAPSNAQNYITNGFGGGLATYTANNAWTETMKFPVSMRTTPTLTLYSVNLPASPTANQWVYYNLASWNSMTSTGPQNCNQDYFNAAVIGTWSANVNFLYAGAWAASAEL